MAKVTSESVDGVDLVVVGGPTHAHGMSRTGTREQATATAREWFEVLPTRGGFGAVFDKIERRVRNLLDELQLPAAALSGARRR